MIVSLRCDCAFFLEKLEIIMCRLWRPECVARQCTGIRGSEVCTLTGDGYEEKDGDYWLKVYQVKMKTYKRIPIPGSIVQTGTGV